jgi:hypothetical protein
VLAPAEQQTLDAVITDPRNDFTANIGATTSYFWLQQYDKIASARDFSTDYMLQWERGMPRWVNSPGFKAALEKLGVPTYWRKHGFPPQCRPVGKRDFTCD